MELDSFDQLFLQRYSVAQPRIYAYILSLHPNRADADELMQDTALALWNKRYEYKMDADFIPWGLSFARFEVLRFRRRAATSSLVFDSELVEILADAASEMQQSGDRPNALAECYAALPDQKRELIRLRYTDGEDVPQIAAHTGKSVAAIYKMLSRIHDTLLTCMQNKMARKR